MRGKKPYNIRNVEAHLNTFRQPEHYKPFYNNNFSNSIGRNLIFQPTIKTSYTNNSLQTPEQQMKNEYINAKFGVSKYTSNLVSGKMFKKV